MKKKLLLLLGIIFISLSVCGQANESVKKETYLYAVKDADSLFLDRYYIPSELELKPCVMFVFGGGFVSGRRDASGYNPYFERLAQKGYTVVSIDYRLGLKNFKADKSLNPMRFVHGLSQAITMAVEDLYDATNYVIEHSAEWNINKDQIIASGSSAGAVGVLQAEYNIANKTDLAKKLPENFNYAGIVGFAGAIFSMNGDLVWQNQPCPIQLFHGDADRSVPYNKLEMGNIGIYGSKHIANQLDNLNYPYYFYNVSNAAHELAEAPMWQNMNEILTFIEKYAIAKQALSIKADVKQIGSPELDKDFDIMDYVKANFGM